MRKVLFSIMIGIFLTGCSLPPEEVQKRKVKETKKAIEKSKDFTKKWECINGHSYEVRIYSVGGGRYIPIHIPLFDTDGLAIVCSGNEQ